MYRMLRVFCATSWELEGERRAFYDLIGHFNATAAMARGVLYVPVSLTNIRDKRPYQYVVDENIRDSRHFITALTESWGPPERNFREDYRLAVTSSRNDKLPMHGVALLLRNTSDGPPPFAGELESTGISPILFADVPEFNRHVTQLLSAWLEVDAGESTTGV
jgi:hypothetical protein